MEDMADDGALRVEVLLAGISVRARRVVVAEGAEVCLTWCARDFALALCAASEAFGHGKEVCVAGVYVVVCGWACE